MLSAGAGMLHVLPASIAKALAIDPIPGSTFFDAEHIVLLMQENRSFDHTYGTLQGVRGFEDPRAIQLPDKNPVWLQTNEKGETYAPFRFDIKSTKITWMDSLPHSWSNQVDARNNGKYDKWLDSKRSGSEDYENMPLTLGYYTRKDIPFYYALADAFTVCDQNFCSSLTGTTPNRLYFWTGTIRENQKENDLANVWNEDADYDTMVNWKTFPERLEEQGVSWKIYQNEISVGVGFEGEEDAWLSNFGDNPIEYFKQYNVKFSPEFIANLPKAAIWLNEEIKKKEQELPTLTDAKKAEDTKNYIDWLKKQLVINAEDQKIYTKENYEKLSDREKSIHKKAFSTNRKDPSYHQLSTLHYDDSGTAREVQVPKGDIFHELREDVKNGMLPTVSWIVAPQNFSDHPSSAWYGAWYISEVMDILTKNPEVWKKTIFILTYDENDGYFDHVPPFVPPHPHKDDTGKTSAGIDVGVEYVSSASQQSIADHARESPIGLGYRVPMVIASPWSRGGWICSEIFDHTSSLQFLETYLSKKTGKKIEETNISAWRRTVCGDLTSSFRPWNGEKIMLPKFVERDEFIEGIHKAQFKNMPSNYKKLTLQEIAQFNRQPHLSPYMPAQEKGVRSSCALPYELYVDGQLSADKNAFEVTFEAKDNLFAGKAAGSPFHVYAPGSYQHETMRSWAYAVKAGDRISDNWMMSDFENNHYHLRVYGPNGFFREFAGTTNDPLIIVNCDSEMNSFAGRENKFVLMLENKEKTAQTIEIIDNAYKTGKRTQLLGAAGSKTAKAKITLDTIKSFGWYDLTIRIKGNNSFEKKYAGRIETGRASKTDPQIGMNHV